MISLFMTVAFLSCLQRSLVASAQGEKMGRGHGALAPWNRLLRRDRGGRGKARAVSQPLASLGAVLGPAAGPGLRLGLDLRLRLEARAVPQSLPGPLLAAVAAGRGKSGGGHGGGENDDGEETD